MNAVYRFRSLTPAGKARFIGGITFFMLYFALGIVFLFVRNLPFAMSPLVKTGFGAILIAYSVFRLVRIIRDLRAAAEDDEKTGVN